MSTKTISLDLDSANLHWLEACAAQKGRRSLSEALNEILARLRTTPQPAKISSVQGTIRLPDQDLAAAQDTVRKMFEQSLERTARQLEAPPGSKA